MKKKIAICTLYDSVNCGTFLQAYSLKKTFEKLGFEVFFLKLKNDNSKITKSKEKRNIQIKEILIKLIRKIKLQFVFKKDNKQFKTIELDELNNDTSFEYVIIGSDEIWNINNNSFTHYIEYFGYNFKNKKIIAYAPSANDTTREDLLNKYEIDKDNLILDVQSGTYMPVLSNTLAKEGYSILNGHLDYLVT